MTVFLQEGVWSVNVPASGSRDPILIRLSGRLRENSVFVQQAVVISSAATVPEQLAGFFSIPLAHIIHDGS